MSDMSADGKRVCFFSDDGPAVHLYVCSPDGTGLREIGYVARHVSRLSGTLEVSDPAYFPMWSPDGRRISFLSRYTLYVVNVD